MMGNASDANLPPGHNPLSLLRRITLRLFRHGPSWLVQRIGQEIRQPLTPPGRGINAALRKAAVLHRRLGRNHSTDAAPDTLLAVYDLNAEPATFDLMWFLLAAECERRRLGLKAMNVIVIERAPGDDATGDCDYEHVISRSSQRDRIINLLAPLAWAVPSVSGVEILCDRRVARRLLAGWNPMHLFPKDFSVDLHRSCVVDCIRDAHRLVPGTASDLFRASDAALAYVDRWVKVRGGGRPIVSITIRQYRYMPARNSNLAAWSRAARYLEGRGYFPVFVPDTDSLAEPVSPELEAFALFKEGSLNINLRLALYQRSFINLGINNGPPYLFMFDGSSRGIIFKIITQGVPQADAAFVASRGYVAGGQLPFATPFQKWVWENDDFEVIKREFEGMEKVLQSHGIKPAAAV